MTEWNAGSFDENVMTRLTWISCVAFSPGGVSAPTITSSSGCELLAGSGFGDEVPGPELRDANDTGVAAPA